MCVYIYIIIYHYISLYIIIYHYISLYIIIYHYISLYIIIYHYISLYIIIYHYISLYIIIYHYISLYIIIYHYIYTYVYILWYIIYMYLWLKSARGVSKYAGTCIPGLTDFTLFYRSKTIVEQSCNDRGNYQYHGLAAHLLNYILLFHAF